MIVGHRQMDGCGVALWNHVVKSLLRSAAERKRGLARRFIDDAYILHEHAAFEAGADRFGKSLLGGEALGVGAGAGERPAFRLAPLDLGEDPVDEAVAEPLEPSRRTSSCATWLPPPIMFNAEPTPPPPAAIAIMPEVVPASTV